jgi:hypothetical protein
MNDETRTELILEANAIYNREAWKIQSMRCQRSMSLAERDKQEQQLFAAYKSWLSALGVKD